MPIYTDKNSLCESVHLIYTSKQFATVVTKGSRQRRFGNSSLKANPSSCTRTAPCYSKQGYFSDMFKS